MWVYYFFATIVVMLGIASLKGGFAFLKYVRSELSLPVSTFTPFASIVAPCRGLDQGLKENLTALFMLHYPAYEIIFVTDNAEDPAIACINEVRRECEVRTQVKSRIVIAGEATNSGQKVHNLRAAVNEADSTSKVFVFVDSDARPNATWLGSLVAPLADERIGATTGYRWFIPVRGGFSSKLRSVWNASIASALGDRTDKNFCWGGSTAVLRSTFESLEMRERWKGTLSDDFALTRTLRRAGLPIYFVPACLTPSFEDCSFTETLEFTTRQLKITRVYASHLWKAALVGSGLFVAVFFGGIVIVLSKVLFGLTYALPLSLFGLIFALGAWKSHLRLTAVRLVLHHYESQVRKGTLAHLTLWPLASALYLYNSICAAFSRRVKWRGITYELKSPTETVIMRNEEM